MEKISSMKVKPHAVCIPYPAQGHINPMMKLAKILHSTGFHVTFVNTHYNHNRLLRAHGPTALDGLPTFRFESIPDGLPSPAQGEEDKTQDTPSLVRSTEQHCVGPFRALVERLNQNHTASSGITCIVSDAIMYFAHDVAEEIGIPSFTLWPAGASSFLALAQYEKLLHMGLIPFKDANYMTNGELDMVLDWIPGANGIRLRDIPDFIRTTDPNDFMLHIMIRIMHNLKRASAIFLNSFDALEHESIQAISYDFPPLYTIGPLQLLLDSIDNDEDTRSIRSNLWKEDSYCLIWLDSHKEGTVVYVNFGSITVMTNEQLVEFAWGLANSNQPFLWIIRPDLVTGDSAILPQEFLVETKGRGLTVGWCDQERVLGHPAVGGFLTHCGWNSMIESIYSGMPMICWPFFADQPTNCWYCCTKWKVGMQIDANVKRDEVESQVKELMAREKGKEMKKKAKELRKLAQEAVMVTSGSSYSNFERAIKMLLSQH